MEVPDEDITLPQAIQIALSHQNAGRLAEAESIYRQVLSFDPANYDALHLLGVVAIHEKRYEQAMELLGQAISVNPTVFLAHFNMGVACQELGRLEEAQACYEKVLSLDPDLADAHFKLGVCHSGRGEKEQARKCFEKVLAIQPDAAEAHYNLGVLFQEQGELGKARACYEKALALKPDHAEACNNLGNVLYDEGLAEEAIQRFEQVLRLKPGIKPEFNLAQALLCRGRFAEGWALYEHRFDTVPRRDFPHEPWRGERLHGKTILIWGDQGIGDQIQFASMFPEVIATAGRCIIECSNKLVPLFARSFPDALVVPRTDPPHPATLDGVDFQCSSGGLARWLRPSLKHFPRREGYLAPDRGRVAYWQRRLAALGPGPKVGFAWRSSKTAGVLQRYSTAIDQWGPIFRVRGVHFINLQYDECASELAAARSRFGVPLMAFPEVDLFDDLAEAAALTNALDLVIAPPTSTSILSAALEVPTWTMIYGADWQTHGTDHNPWHLTMKRFPRHWDQRWDEVIDLVAGQLDELSRYAFRNFTAPGLVPVRYPSDLRLV